MTNRFNLPDIEFLEKAPELIEREMLLHVEEKTGLVLQRADARRKFLQALTTFVSIERNKLEHGMRQNRLAYAEDDMLEHRGTEMATERIPAKAAKTMIAFTLEVDRPNEPFIVSAGEQIAVGDVYFAFDETLIIPAGESNGVVSATCTEEGEVGNGYLVGEISTLVKPLPYVKAVQNTTISYGGADKESDDAYAERILLAPESFSVAGPELAYIYWAKKASAEIGDVKADSPSEGHVHVYILMKDGRMPTNEEILTVGDLINDSSIRPLTDYVTIRAPEQVPYEAIGTYWISKENSTVATIIQKQIEDEFQKYLIWQRSKMGRDVDLSELISRLKQKGAARVEVNSPMFMEITRYQVATELPTSALNFGGITDE